MTSGFEKHRITHSSPSAINTWIENPAFWMMQKLYGKKYPYGFAAKRGIVIEDAVVNVIAKGYDEDKAIEMALKEYDIFGALSSDPRREKERESIEPTVRLLNEELKQYGEPTFPEDSKQHKVELVCKGDNWELPIMGYLDLYYPQHGMIIDIKTTSRMPSTMSDAHRRQAGLYAKASGNQHVKFLYATPKKLQYLECGDVDGTIAEVKQHIIRQESFLSVSEDKNFLAKIVPLQTDSFYYDSLEAVRDRKEIFGI